MTGWLLSSIPGLLHLGGDRGVGHACPGVSCSSQGALLPSVMGGLIGKLMGELMGATLLPLLLHALQNPVLLLMHHLQSKCKYEMRSTHLLWQMPYLHGVWPFSSMATMGCSDCAEQSMLVTCSLLSRLLCALKSYQPICVMQSCHAFWGVVMV